MKAKKFVLKQEYVGFPKSTDVEIIEEELPSLKDDEYLAEAVYISVDPYMRSHPQPVGNTLIGQQIAKIIESKTSNYPVGRYVLGSFGWRTHTISTDKPTPSITDRLLPEYLIGDIGNLPLSLSLGILGMPGVTAYFGFLDICDPKKGETVVVSGAAGAVGHHVGQIAKIIGCNVIGIVGSEAKGKWITEELGFDGFVNYKNCNLKEDLKKGAPNGIDCYFDNVGGDISTTVISLMNFLGRISVCGFSSEYNLECGSYKVSAVQADFVSKSLRMEGFVAYQFIPRWKEAVEQNFKWIQEGKLKYRETVTEGFENTLQAFVDMLHGRNIGKAVVKV